MYCLRLFIVVLQELHCLLQCLPWLLCVFIEKHMYTASIFEATGFGSDKIWKRRDLEATGLQQYAP